MKKELSIIFILLFFQNICFSQKTYTGANGSWNIAANWTPNGVPTVSDDVIIPSGKSVNIPSNSTAKSISVSGTLFLQNGQTLIVGSTNAWGNFTINSGGSFTANDNQGTTTLLIVYGNYINNGTTDFWKSTVIITGDLLSPSTSGLQNQGNVVVGGNIIGDFNLTGGTGTNQIYAVNPNATVTITPPSVDNNVIPGATVESGLIDLVNTVIYGSTCSTFNIVDPTNKSICESSSTTFTISFANPQPVNPTFQWQLNNGNGWTDVTDISVYTGFTTATLTIVSPTSSMNGNKFRIKVTSDSCTRYSDYSTLNVGNSTVTWNGTAWSSTPTSNDKVVFNGNYISTGNLSACSCKINSGNVTFNSGHSFILTNELTISGGSLTFEDTSSLVQVNNNVANSGNIIYKRKTTPLKQFDYTYWSSPLASQTLSQLATNSLFYSYNTSINNWETKSATTVMQSGVGYLGRSPSNLDYTTPQIVETTFIGTPNNGTITTPIIKSTSVANLLGNPYPSAIDADLFITNSSNINNINGTLYFWTHNTAITSNNYSTNDYAKYNLIGGVKTASAAISGGVVPTGKIAAGQGFFVEANAALANGTYSATFNNSMRISNSNNQFFKSSESNATTTNNEESIEKHRFWISLSNTEGVYNEFLVGYVSNATNGFDSLYDGRTLPSGNAISIYTLLDTTNLSIQGRSLPFTETDVIPLGYSSTFSGQLIISLENFDGLFNDQDIYLFDKSNGSYHNIKSNYFTFTTSIGTFDDRFEIRFSNSALSNDQFSGLENEVIVYNENNQLVISSKNTSISKIELYDLLGKQIFIKDGLSTYNYQTNLNVFSNNLYIAKITLNNEQEVVRKVILK